MSVPKNKRQRDGTLGSNPDSTLGILTSFPSEFSSLWTDKRRRQLRAKANEQPIIRTLVPRWAGGGVGCWGGVGEGRLLPMRKWLLSPPSSPAPPGFDFQPPALSSLPPYSQWEHHCKQRKGESDSCCRGIFAHGWNDLAPDSLEGGAAGRLLYISVP